MERQPARVPRDRKDDEGGTRALIGRRALRHALSYLAARGGQLHCPDDAQVEPREPDVARRAAPFVGVALVVCHERDRATRVIVAIALTFVRFHHCSGARGWPRWTVVRG